MNNEELQELIQDLTIPKLLKDELRTCYCIPLGRFLRNHLVLHGPVHEQVYLSHADGLQTLAQAHRLLHRGALFVSIHPRDGVLFADDAARLRVEELLFLHAPSLAPPPPPPPSLVAAPNALSADDPLASLSPTTVTAAPYAHAEIGEYWGTYTTADRIVLFLERLFLASPHPLVVYVEDADRIFPAEDPSATASAEHLRALQTGSVTHPAIQQPSHLLVLATTHLERLHPLLRVPHDPRYPRDAVIEVPKRDAEMFAKAVPAIAATEQLGLTEAELAEEVKRLQSVDPLSTIQGYMASAASLLRDNPIATLPLKERLTKHVERVDSRHQYFFGHGSTRVWDRLFSDESAFERLRAHMAARIIGQDHVIDAFIEQLAQNLDLGDERQGPLVVMSLIGTPGTGKTEFGRAFAEFVYGKDQGDRAKVIDCTKIQNSAQLTTWLGAPKGYVGYESGGTLYNIAIEDPCAILVPDEPDKVEMSVTDPEHKTFFLPWYQILQSGRVTDELGRDVSFRNCVIIFCGNSGSREAISAPTAEQRLEIMFSTFSRNLPSAMQRRLRPYAIVYRSLEPADCERILRTKFIPAMLEPHAKKVDVSLADAVVPFLMGRARAMDPDGLVMGATPYEIQAKALAAKVAAARRTHRASKALRVSVAGDQLVVSPA